MRTDSLRPSFEDRLPDSQRMLETLLSNLPGMVYRSRVDPDWTVEFVSDGCTELTGYKPEDLVGNRRTSFERLTHPDDYPAVDAAVRAAIERHEPFRLIYRIITAIGDVKWVSEQGHAIRGSTDAPAVALEGFITDITALKKTEDSLQQRTNFMQLQQVVAAAAHEAQTVESAMQTALDLVCAYTGWPVGHAYFVSEHTPRELLPTNIWHVADHQRYRVLQEAIRTVRIPAGVGLPGRVLASGKPMAVLDLKELADNPCGEFAHEAQLNASVAIPVSIGTDVVAVLEFFFHDGPEPSDRLMQVLTFVGSQLGRVVERKRAEEALQRREKQFRALIENGSDIISILERDGTIRYESPSIQRILGYTPEELVGHNAFQLIHPDDLPQTLAAFTQTILDASHTALVEFRFRHKDGSWRMFEGIGKNLLGEPGFSGIIVNCRDITERRRVEEALRNSEERFRSLFTKMREAFALYEIILDAEGQPTDYRFLEVNDAFEAITGLQTGQVIGHTVREIFPAVKAFWLDTFSKVALTGEPLRFEQYADALNKQLEVGLYRPKPGQLAAIFSDITERKRAEQRLRLQGMALTSAANGMALTDRSGIVLWVNPALTKLTGYSAEELVGKNMRLLKSGQHDEAFYSNLWQTINAGNPWQGEIVNRHKDGTLYTEEMTITPVRDANGEVTHFIAIKQNITERKNAEATLRATNRRLEHALVELNNTQQQVVQQERLRALGTMASGIAHDFNNALASILGFSELILNRPAVLDDRAKTMHFVQLMNTAAKDAGNVVNRLREFYRHREAGEILATVQLNDLVTEAISLTQPKWKNQTMALGITIEVITDLNPDLPAVAGNAADLREVFTNLVFNAVDAMPRGGTITLRTRVEDGNAILTVADSGIGMTEEIRRRCFEPFFSTKGERGTGLGLSMVYGIIQRHDGQIEVESSPGKGTTFSIRLPVPVHSTPVVAENAATAPTRPLSILLIEDEELVREILTEFLTGDGHQVIPATDGRAGLQQFATGQFDIVLVDRAMPGMNGDQVAAAIKKQSPQMPVVLITGFGSMMQAAGEKPVGVDLVVSKPVTLEALRAALAKVTGA